MGRGKIASPLLFSFWEMVSEHSHSRRGNVTVHTHAHISEYVIRCFSIAVKYSTFIHLLLY